MKTKRAKQTTMSENFERFMELIEQSDVATRALYFQLGRVEMAGYDLLESGHPEIDPETFTGDYLVQVFKDNPAVVKKFLKIQEESKCRYVPTRELQAYVKSSEKC